MPCFQSNVLSLDFQAADLSLLQKAAVALGLAVNDRGDRRELMDRGVLIATLVQGKATCRPEHVVTVNRLRVQYAKEIIGNAALKTGWQKVAKSANKFILRKGC